MKLRKKALLNELNLGLIGLGERGKIHLRNCLSIKNARLTAVSDISEKSLFEAKKAGVKHVFKDYTDLLKDRDIGAVIISLPNFLHAEAAIKAAEHGKHILIEKPLARNVTEAESIVSAAKLNDVKLMVGYPLRFSPSFIKLKNEIDHGTLGDVQIANAILISTGPLAPRGEKSIPKPVPSWWFDKKLTGGGALIDLGCYMVNILKWYLGAITNIQSRLGHRFNMDFEDHANCILEFKNRTIATLNVGWFARYHRVQVNLYGTAKYASAIESTSLLDYAIRIFKGNTSSSVYRELTYFVDCLNSDTFPLPSGEEGLEDLRVISAAYKNTF